VLGSQFLTELKDKIYCVSDQVEEGIALEKFISMSRFKRPIFILLYRKHVL